MATYISTLRFTLQGEAQAQNSCDRAEAFRKEAPSMGIEVKEMYWTMGATDGVLIFDAADDETAVKAMLALGMKGNVRTETMRAFTLDEMRPLVGSLG